MYCLKCGRDTTDDHVFCSSCQEAMDHYPIKPGTAVHLPRRSFTVPGKKPAARKRSVPPEEQVLTLKRALRRTRLCIVILVVALSLTAVLLIREFASGDAPIIGQNYTIDTNLDSD